MRSAHVDSMIALGEPFRADAPVPYPFARQTITERVKGQIPLMLRERQRPPPPETYSLNRKLSGAFLLCARLQARVNCRDLFARVTQPYPPSVPRAPLHTRAGEYLGEDLSERWSHVPTERSEVRRVRHEKRQRSRTLFETPSASDTQAGHVRVRDVQVPVRPRAPGPEDCCMSGCVNCVHTIYLDELEEYKSTMKGIRERLSHYEPPIAPHEWDTKRLGPMPHANAAETEAHASEEADTPKLDASMSAFLELERKIKSK